VVGVHQTAEEFLYAVAVAPEPGWIYANYNLFYGAEADSAVLQRRVNAGLDTFAYINMSAGLFAFDKPVLGGRLAVGVFVPLGHGLQARRQLR
jgi:hypothetical protein